METDHARLSKLYKDDPAAFERERDRLINETIEGAPEEEREKLRTFQQKIDKIMDGAGPKRMEVLGLMMQSNLQEVNRQLNGLKNILAEVK